MRMPPRVVVRKSTFFDAQFEKLRERTGDFQRTVLSEAEDMLENLHLPTLLVHPKTRLEAPGVGKSRIYDLTGVHRLKRGFHPKLKHHGLRLFYIWARDGVAGEDDEVIRVVALEFGARNPGRPDDAYTEFGERLQRGYHDRYFVLLGLRHAYWKLGDAPVPVKGRAR